MLRLIAATTVLLHVLFAGPAVAPDGSAQDQSSPQPASLEGARYASDSMLQYAYIKNRLLDLLKLQRTLLGRFGEFMPHDSPASTCPLSVSTSEVQVSLFGTCAGSGCLDNDDDGGGSVEQDTGSTWHSSLSDFLKSNADVHTRLGQPLRVVVVGQVSHGKTLLVNGLLKDDVLPSMVGPVSHFSVVVQGTDDDQPYAQEADGERLLNMQELARLVDKGEIGCSQEDTCEQANQTVRLFWPRSRSRVLQHDIEIWDTAGFDYVERINDVIHQQCLHGDVVLAVVDASMGLSLSLAKMLRDLDHAKVLVAFSKWDFFAKDITSQRVESMRRAYTNRTKELVFHNCSMCAHSEQRIFFIDSLAYWRTIQATQCSIDSSDDGRQCPPKGSTTSGNLESAGSLGFQELERELYKLTAGNGILFKLASSWMFLKQSSQELMSLVGKRCTFLSRVAATSAEVVKQLESELQRLPSKQDVIAGRLDSYLDVLLRAKLSTLSSIIGDLYVLEQDMLRGADKEVAARRHIRRLNEMLIKQAVVPDRLGHEVAVQRVDLLEVIPESMRPALSSVLRQSDGKLQLTLSDCALAEFQASALILFLYSVLRVVCSLVMAYLLMILQPLRRLGLILTAFALLYAVLVLLNFDSEVERTRHLVRHVDHSLQHVTHRRLAAASDQHRSLVLAEVEEQFAVRRTALEADYHALELYRGCVAELNLTCSWNYHEAVLLHRNIADLEQLIA